MDSTSLSVIILGFFLGMKHALDADHLAAVSTLIAGRERRWRAALIGVRWGIGHALALLAAGSLIVLFDVRFSPTFSAALEAVVGVMLVGLGIRVLVRVRSGGTLHVHAHSHHSRVHVHPHIHDPGKDHPVSGIREHGHGGAGGKLPLVVGSIHGLAGSAALTLMLLPALRSRLEGIAYLVVFGAGSILGMALTTYLVSIPLSILKSEGRGGKILTVCAGSLSLLVGAVLIVEMGSELFVR